MNEELIGLKIRVDNSSNGALTVPDILYVFDLRVHF